MSRIEKVKITMLSGNNENIHMPNSFSHKTTWKSACVPCINKSIRLWAYFGTKTTAPNTCLVNLTLLPTWIVNNYYILCGGAILLFFWRISTTAFVLNLFSGSFSFFFSGLLSRRQSWRTEKYCLTTPESKDDKHRFVS